MEATSAGLEMYRLMLTARRFEEKSLALSHAGKFSNYHSCLGQEALGVGACYQLERDDIVFPSYRGIAVRITRGFKLKDLMAGLFHKSVAPTRGRIPMHHTPNIELGVWGTTAMQGSIPPIAAGSALASKMLKTNQVSICFFGDGGSNRGDFHEALNLAGIWKLPVIFVCENNFFAKSMPVSRSTAGGSIWQRAASYGIPGELVDGNSVLAMQAAVRRGVERARSGDGATLLECETYRWEYHSTEGDREKEWAAGLDEWKAKCPIERFEKVLLEQKLATRTDFGRIGSAIDAEIDEAVAYAQAAPDAVPEHALENVYR